MKVMRVHDMTTAVLHIRAGVSTSVTPAMAGHKFTIYNALAELFQEAVHRVHLHVLLLCVIFFNVDLQT